MIRMAFQSSPIRNLPFSGAFALVVPFFAIDESKSTTHQKRHSLNWPFTIATAVSQRNRKDRGPDPTSR